MECVCDLLKRYAGAKSLGTDSNMQDFWKFWLIDDIKQSYRKTYLPLMQKTAAVQRKIRTFVYSLRHVIICDHNKSYCVFVTPLILELQRLFLTPVYDVLLVSMVIYLKIRTKSLLL